MNKVLLALTALFAASLACNTLLPTATPIGQPETEELVELTELPTLPFDAPDNPNPGPDGIGDPYFEDLGNGGYDVAHYSLALAVDMENNQIVATATISAKATQTLTSLNLELAGLIVDDIRVDGQDAIYHRQGIELTIFLPQAVSAEQDFQVEVEYHGTPGEGEDGFLPEYSEGWVHYGEGVFVAGEPTGASSWYPVNEHPLDKATYSYAITVEDPYEVAANGVLLTVEENGHETTYTWEMDDPIAPYLTTVAIAEFDVEESAGPHGLPIRNYYGVGVTDNVRDDFARQGDMIAYFEEIFGPYPFDAYGVVVHDQDLGFALETATLVVFGDGFTDEYVVSHELSHMWFGDSVSLKVWKDIWLNEGFATYASDLWNEHVRGRAALDAGMRGYYEELALFSAFYSGAPIGDPGPDGLFDFSVYYRGALTLHALRLEIGDEAFFETLRAYTARFAHSNADTADFIAVAEEVSGQQLDALFDAWLYQSKLPDIPEMDLFLEDFQ